MGITQEPWFPGFVTGMLALIGVIAAALLQARRERKRDEESSKSPAPPTTQQVWERQDRMERVLQSAVVLLSEVADQWKGEHPPVFSKRHLEIVAAAGFLPPEWEPQTTEDE